MAAACFFRITKVQRAWSIGNPTTSPHSLLFLLRMITTTPRYSNSKRISIVLHPLLFTRLQGRSDQEGRSLSNLCAYLLERALDQKQS